MIEPKNGLVVEARWPLCWEFVIVFLDCDKVGDEFIPMWGALAISTPGGARGGTPIFHHDLDGSWRWTTERMKSMAERQGWTATGQRIAFV